MRTVALFIDGGNVSASYADMILERARGLGDLVVRRVYGDAAQRTHWEAASALRFIHSGHNAHTTGRLLAEDALETLAAGTVDIFVLVGRDGRLEHLAHRIRRAGKRTIGISEGGAFAPSDHSRPAVQPPAGSPRRGTVRPGALDWSIRELVSRQAGDAFGVPLKTFGLHMWNRHRTRLSDIEEASWRGYLRARPGLYDVMHTASGTRIRIRPEGFLGDMQDAGTPFPSHVEPLSIHGCRTTHQTATASDHAIGSAYHSAR